jgi:methylmalonyl-CoA mutase cobalamin-binding domain/chain
MVHAMNRRLEGYLPSVAAAVDWAVIEAKRDLLIEGAQRFYRAVLEGFRVGGIDIKDALQMLLLLKRLGAERMEELFGAGRVDPSFPRGREPVLQTDLLRNTLASRDSVLASLPSENGHSLDGHRVVVASTDIHEMANFLLDSALTEAGANVTNCGMSCDPEDIVKVMIESDAESVVITTHNGVARSFASTLRDTMVKERLADRAVFMGGVLNEDVEGSPTPVDVRDDLNQLGIATPSDIVELITVIRQRVSSATP